MNTTLTIVIPAYNESRRIIKTLNEIDEYILHREPADYLVLVVDDGCLDDTKEVVSSWIKDKSKNKGCFKVISYSPNKGKGYAVREGFSNTNTDLVLYTDADGASPIQEVEKLLSAINEGFDLACGSRVLKGDGNTVEMSFKRRFVGFTFQCILKLFGLAPLKDTQCGFKLFKIDVAKKLAQNRKCFNYSFDIEYLFLAKKFGYKIKEVPINWYHVKGSKVSIFRDSIKMLIEVLEIRFMYKYNW